MTALWRTASELVGEAGTCGPTAADVLRELAPHCKPTVIARLRREGILSAVDLAGLDKEDLRELGCTMLERARVLRWAREGMPLDLRRAPPLPGDEGAAAPLAEEPSTDMQPVSPAEEEARRHLDEVEQQADFWCSFVRQGESAELAASPSHGRFRRERSLSMGEEVEDVRENMLERVFDLTSERVAQLFSHMRGRSPDGLMSLDALRRGLHRCGLPQLGDDALSRVVEAVSRARCAGDSRGSQRRGVSLAEFEAILSRLKLAQLLSGACPLPLDSDTLGGRRMMLGARHVDGMLMAVDYNTQTASVRQIVPGRFKEFFFGHRKQPRAPGEPPLVRWVHMYGLDLTLLLALTVKYSLHPLGVEDVIEQCPAKIDRYGNHYFAAVEQLCLASPMDGSEAIQVHGCHMAVFCAGPPLFDTIITITEPDHDEKEDWPGGALRDASGVGDVWVTKLCERLEASHSRLRERRADFMMYQILDLSSDELVKVTRAYTTRLNHLEEKPHITASGLLSEWLGEVSLAQQQLTVVARRLRGLQRLVRRVIEDPDLTTGMSGYVGDVRDHIDEAHEDATYLVEKCRAILETGERALERHHAYCRQKADDRLNMMVFVLTGATAIFAPVQFMAGVYGMNFVDADGRPTIPELTWIHGYSFFWALVVSYLAASSSCAVLLHRRLKGKRKEDLGRIGGPLHPRALAAGVVALWRADGNGTSAGGGLAAPLLGGQALGG